MSEIFQTPHLLHPLTGQPIVPVGFRRDGRPIMPIMGAAEDDSADDADDTEALGDKADEAAETGDEADRAESGDDADDSADDADDTEALGDKGQQALERMKAKVKVERAKRVTAEKALKAKEDGADDGKDAEAVTKANARIVRSEVKAAAKGVLADPQDAYKFLDIEQFEVDDDGNVDEDEIADAIADLVKKKPYLAVQDGRKFKGSADGGVRKGTTKSLDAQIAEATKAGDFQKAIALKQQRAADLKDKK